MSIKDAMAIAKKYSLEWEIERAIKNGYSPEDALREWDIF